MCKSGLAASVSTPAPSRRTRTSSRSAASSAAAVLTSSSSPVGSHRAGAATSSSSTSSASSSRASLAAARASLPDPPVLYPFAEIAAATNNFLAKRVSSSAASYWRCSLRGRDAAVFQLRSEGRDAAAAKAALARIGKSHHTSLARLLGACLAGDHVYLAYELPPGAATLAACLHNPRNPSVTALPTWVSRVQVAADVAQGLEYIHHHAGAVHGRLSSSAVLISDPGLRARLSHFGAAELVAAEQEESPYTAPETAAAPSREADVYAFGVLLLELVSGKEPAKYRFDRARKEFLRVSVVETAAEAVAGEDAEARSGRVRRWVDRRLRDSFPVAAAERLVEVGLRCAAAAAAERPEMTWVVGKVSKMYLESKAWEQKIRVPTEFSVSAGPR